jgi:dCMP deaminase
MLIISVGIKKVVAKRKYHAAQESRELFKKAGIKLLVINDTIVEYDDQ